LAELQSVEPLITEDVFAVLGVEKSVESRVSYGGTAPANVRRQAQGWLDARAEGRWDTTGTPRLRVEVREGERARLATVAVAAPSRADSAALGAGLGLEAGSWVSPPLVGRALDRAVRAASDHGYPYATIGVSGWDRDSAGVHLRLAGARGPAVTIARVRVEGLKVTREAFALRTVGALSGAAYDRAAAEGARDRLAQTGLFRAVTYDGLEGDADMAKGTLVYRVEEPRYNRFEGVVGVQGGAGTVGTAHLELGNLMGTGRATALDWRARGPGLTDFGARYTEPRLLGAPLRLEGSILQQVQDTLFTRTRWGARARYALSVQEGVEVGLDDQSIVQARGEAVSASLQGTTLAVEHSGLDEPLSPRRGVRARLEAVQVTKSEHLRAGGQRSSRASTLEGRAEWHHPLRGGAGLALEVRGAARFSSERVLALYDRWPLGGAASLRGFDEEAFRVDRYVLARTEWRWFLGAGGQRVALFWDHAWMQTRLPVAAGGDRLDRRAVDGIGAGLRLEAAGGLVGVDYGLEPGRPPLEGKIHLQLITTF
jgi:translocation and assembly module TamA